MKSKKTALAKTLDIGFFIILTLPLLSLPPYFTPPPWGKTIVFRSLMSLLLFGWLWEIFFYKKDYEEKNPKNKTLFILGFVWWLSLFLATLFSLDKNHSLWSSPLRSWGLVNISFYFLFALFAFYRLKKDSWKKVWDFTFGVGGLICLIAIVQKLNLWKTFLAPQADRPSGTLGNPVFLGVYLVLLSLLALVFGLKETKSKRKKSLYFAAFALFSLVLVFVTLTRAAYLGWGLGLFYLFLFYKKTPKIIKIGLVFSALLAIGFVFWLNLQDQPPFWAQNNLFVGRLLLTEGRAEASRLAGWKIALRAFKDRPVLGYGLNNFSIAFDRYYGFKNDTADNLFYRDSHWWDHGHNLYLETLICCGLIGLGAFLVFIAWLFWKLQQLKKEWGFLGHGLQSVLIGYLTVAFFSIDTFSTFLVFFLFLAYCGRLTAKEKAFQQNNHPQALKNFFFKIKWPLVGLLSALMVVFIFNYNVLPLEINKKIALAKSAAEKRADCQQGVEIMEEVISRSSFLDHHLRLEYVNVMGACIKNYRETQSILAPRAIAILKENAETSPFYTRNWLFLGAYTNLMIAGTDNEKTRNELKEQAEAALLKAQELNPKRQEIFSELNQTYLLSHNFSLAEEKARECLNDYPFLTVCWWHKALANIYLGEKEKAQEDIAMAEKLGFQLHTLDSFYQLANAHIYSQNYADLIGVYQAILVHDPNNSQVYASLAYAYKLMGEYEQAKQMAAKVSELDPSLKSNVEEFLKELEQAESNL